jgi:hypothetical protein
MFLKLACILWALFAKTTVLQKTGTPDGPQTRFLKIVTGGPVNYVDDPLRINDVTGQLKGAPSLIRRTPYTYLTGPLKSKLRKRVWGPFGFPVFAKNSVFCQKMTVFVKKTLFLSKKQCFGHRH